MENNSDEPEGPGSWSSYFEKLVLTSLLDDCWGFIDGQSLVARWFDHGRSHSGLGYSTRHINSEIHSKKS